jgi:two-component system, response regulator PdtaR
MDAPASLPKILVVEDDPIVACDLAEEFAAAGFSDVTQADCLRDALRAIDGRTPHVAVVDLNLCDGATGAQLAAALARSGVRVCVLSASATDKLSSLPHIYLAKPVPASLVAQVVGSQLALSTAAQSRTLI